jgi:hypothetical protein
MSVIHLLCCIQFIRPKILGLISCNSDKGFFSLHCGSYDLVFRFFCEQGGSL